MDPVQMIQYLGKALQKKGDVQAEIVEEVSNLASSIMQACVYTSMRLNQALVRKEVPEKLDILIAIQQGEIEAHTRMNEMCAPVMHAALELHNFFSNTNLNTPVGKKDDLLELFNALVAGERGVQGFMEEYLSISSLLTISEPKELDQHIKGSLEKLRELMKAAQECQFSITSIL